MMCVMLLKLLPVLKHHLYFLADLGYYKLLEFLFCLAGPITQNTHIQSGCEMYLSAAFSIGMGPYVIAELWHAMTPLCLDSGAG